MSKEYLAALVGKKPEDLKEIITVEEFERLDGSKFKTEVIKYDLNNEALISNCKKFYANKIKRVTDDNHREKIVMEREKRIRSIIAGG